MILGAITVLTETRRATPAHPPSPLPRNENRRYETSAPTGLEALKMARCFLHFARGREVARREVVNAKAVGAKIDIQRPVCMVRTVNSPLWIIKARKTIMDSLDAPPPTDATPSAKPSVRP